MANEKENNSKKKMNDEWDCKTTRRKNEDVYKILEKKKSSTKVQAQKERMALMDQCKK